MDRRAVATFLESHEIFRGTPPPVLKRLAAAAEVRVLRSGEPLFRQGEPVSRIAVLVEGLLVASIGLRTGSAATVELVKAGGMWGGLTWLTGGLSLCDVRALAPSRAVLLPAPAVFRLSDVHPPAARALLRDAARRFNRLAALRALSSERSRRKICGILLWLHEAAGSDVPFTHATIASLAGQAPETVSRVLSHFKKRGWISYTRGRLAIVRPDLLRVFQEEA